MKSSTYRSVLLNQYFQMWGTCEQPCSNNNNTFQCGDSGVLQEGKFSIYDFEFDNTSLDYKDVNGISIPFLCRTDPVRLHGFYKPLASNNAGTSFPQGRVSVKYDDFMKALEESHLKQKMHTKAEERRVREEEKSEALRRMKDHVSNLSGVELLFARMIAASLDEEDFNFVFGNEDDIFGSNPFEW